MSSFCNDNSGISFSGKVTAVLLAILFFDCTGWLGLREVIFLILFLTAMVIGLLSHCKFRNREFIAVLFFVISLFPGYFASATGGISTADMLLFGLHPFSIVFSYLIVKNLRISMEHVAYAAWILCIVVLFLHFDALLNLNIFLELREYLSSIPDAGFFNVKNAWGFKAVETYFKFTLYLVPVAVYSYYKKMYVLYIMVLIVLFVAPSRAGLLVALVPFLLRYYWIGIPIFIGVVIVTATNLNSLVSLVLSFQARVHHVYDILNIFSDDAGKLFWGSGPGSAFFSTGFDGLAYDNEISYLELVRRYGILTLVMFTGVTVAYIYNLRCQPSRYAMYSFLVVAASNPVIFTMFGLFLITVLSTGSKPQKLDKLM